MQQKISKDKTTKDLLTDNYSLIVQEKYGNQISRLTTKRNTKKIPMSKNKIARFNDVTAEVERDLNTATVQVMDYVNSIFATSSNQNSDVVEFSIEKYMKDSNLTNARYARAKLRKGLDNLLKVTIYIHGGGITGAMHIYSEYKIKRGGHVIIRLAPTYHKLLCSSLPMPMPKLLFQLNPQSQATAWYILRTLVENKRMNYGEPSADRLKIKYILSKCPSLPPYKDVYDEGHVIRRIIDPFFDSLELLTSAIDYTFVDPTGQPLNYYQDMDYDTFENTTFVVKSWADYPDEYMTLYTKNRKAKRQHKRK